MRKVFIVSSCRTPLGNFLGSISSVSATKLGGIVVREVVSRAGIEPKQVQEIIMGNVLGANLGQAPATQAALFGGLEPEVISTGVNKVCASGMKAISLGAQTIMLGYNDVVVCGGMENMSNTPYYLGKARSGYRYGNGELIDGIKKDGLCDAFADFQMGNAAERCAEKYNISREDQDDYAIESYQRAEKANNEGFVKDEIVVVEVTDKKEKLSEVSEDEGYKRIDYDKIRKLKPAFEENGTVTAANAPGLSDGASALVLMSEERMKMLGVKPVAEVLAFADTAQEPAWFTTSPSQAIPMAIERAGINKEDVDYYEINEAFSVVAIVNNRLLNLDPARVNVFGGAVALGHPLGASGARIVTTLINVLKHKEGKIGVAGICNGGGGASAIVIRRLH